MTTVPVGTANAGVVGENAVVSSDNKYLYLAVPSNTTSNEIAVVNTTTNAVVNTVPLPGSAFDTVYGTAGSNGYVYFNTAPQVGGIVPNGTTIYVLKDGSLVNTVPVTGMDTITTMVASGNRLYAINQAQGSTSYGVIGVATLTGQDVGSFQTLATVPHSQNQSIFVSAIGPLAISPSGKTLFVAGAISSPPTTPTSNFTVPVTGNVYQINTATGQVTTNQLTTGTETVSSGPFGPDISAQMSLPIYVVPVSDTIAYVEVVSEGIHFPRVVSVDSSISLYNFANGTKSALVDMPSTLVPGFTVSPDNKEMYYGAFSSSVIAGSSDGVPATPTPGTVNAYSIGSGQISSYQLATTLYNGSSTAEQPGLVLLGLQGTRLYVPLSPTGLDVFNTGATNSTTPAQPGGNAWKTVATIVQKDIAGVAITMNKLFQGTATAVKSTEVAAAKTAQQASSNIASEVSKLTKSLESLGGRIAHDAVTLPGKFLQDVFTGHLPKFPDLAKLVKNAISVIGSEKYGTQFARLFAPLSALISGFDLLSVAHGIANGNLVDFGIGLVDVAAITTAVLTIAPTLIGGGTAVVGAIAGADVIVTTLDEIVTLIEISVKNP